MIFLTADHAVVPVPQWLIDNKLPGGYAFLDQKLIDLLKNYRQYDLDRTYKNTALQLLNSRGITEQELRFGGNLVNEKFDLKSSSDFESFKTKEDI